MVPKVRLVGDVVEDGLFGGDRVGTLDASRDLACNVPKRFWL
ncbi:hypothetical protein [Okeania sp. SIO3I5]|nr:hypothetical protein [Okeania sp. SIO3I5]